MKLTPAVIAGNNEYKPSTAMSVVAVQGLLVVC